MAQLSTKVFTVELFGFLLVLLSLPNYSTAANSFTANEDGEMNQLRNHVVSKFCICQQHISFIDSLST